MAVFRMVRFSFTASKTLKVSESFLTSFPFSSA
jgi:hypothetical protein